MRSKTITTTLALALPAVLLAFYAPWLLGKASFFLFDITYGWEPFSSYLGRRLACGQIPLWNPYVLNGAPQIAVPGPSVCYPPDWLFGVLPFNVALSAIFVLNQCVAGIAMFALVSEAGWGLCPAVVASVTYALSSTMFSLQTTNSLQALMSWFPGLLWALRRVQQGGTEHGGGGRKPALLAAICAWLCIVSGAVDVAAIALIAAFGYCLWSFFMAGRVGSGNWGVLLLQTAAFLGGVLLSAPLLLPLLEWTALSPRTLGFSFEEIFKWSLNANDVINLFVPQPLGNSNQLDNPFLSLCTAADTGHVPYIQSNFLGPIVITLAIWGLSDKRWLSRIPLMLFAALILVLALGRTIPAVAELCFSLALTVVRYPVKLMPLFIFAASIATARGAGLLAEGRIGVWSVRLTLIVWLACEVAAWLLLVPDVNQSFMPVAASMFGVPISATLHDAVHEVALSFVWFALLGLLLSLPVRCGRPMAWVCAGLIFLLFCWQAWTTLHEAAPADFFSCPSYFTARVRGRSPSPAAAMRERTQPESVRMATTYTRAFPPAGTVVPCGTGDRTVDLYQYNRQVLTPSLNLDARIGDPLALVVAQTREQVQIASAAWQRYSMTGDDSSLAAFCRLSNTAFVLQRIGDAFVSGTVQHSRPPLSNDRFELLEDNPKLDMRLYGVKETLPRAYLAPRVAWGTPHQSVIDYIGAAPASGFDPNKLAILEHRYSAEQAPPVVATTGIIPVEVSDRSPEQVRLDVNAPTAAYAILTDTFYPGWQAKLDGNATPIYRANALFRAVYVPAGKHTVVFTYEPQSFYNGLVVAALMAAFMLVIALGSVPLGAGKMPADPE